MPVAYTVKSEVVKTQAHEQSAIVYSSDFANTEKRVGIFETSKHFTRNPVTPSFYCLDILLELRGHDRKNELIPRGETHCAQMSYFPLLQKIRSKNFLKSL